MSIMSFFFAFAATTIAALMITHPIWLPFILYKFAERNFLVTAIKEGTAKAFMRFGQFNRIGMSWEKHYLSKNWDVIEGVPDGTETSMEAPRRWIDAILPGGLHWVGLPWMNSIYQYHFQWISIRQGALGAGERTDRGTLSIVEQNKLEDLLISRDETPDYIYLKQDVYGITFQDTEDQEMIPLSFIALLTAEVVNPYKALFKTEQWLEQITNFLRRYIKEYVGSRKFTQLVTDSNNGAQTESDEILGYQSPDKNLKVGPYILEKWGVKIEHLNLVNFKTAGKRGEAYESAAAEVYVAERHKAATVIAAQGTSEATKLNADAEAYRATKVAAALSEGGEDARLARTLEAYEKMGENGNTIIIGGDKPAQMLINTAKSK